MKRYLFTVILLFIVSAYVWSRGQELSSTLKEDYFKEMASRESADPEFRLIWYDSLLSVTNPNNIEILKQKIQLLGDMGYSDKVVRLTNEILSNNKLPLHHKLPVLYNRATAWKYSKNLLGALNEFNRLLNIHKPDSLKYWDIKAGLSIFNIYDDLHDRTRAEEWLQRTEAMISSYPLSSDFRRDAEGRCHGSRATLLIEDNKLDSAYKEVKLARELGSSNQAQLASLTQIGQIYILKGQTEAARQYLEQAMILPENGQMRRTAIYMLAYCYLQEKRYAEALNVLSSYQHKSIEVNSMGNTRAYYILRGQAFAGMNDLVMAYNSLDSALVVGDTIIAKMKSFQRINAEDFINLQHKADYSAESNRYLKAGVIILLIALVILSLALIPLLLRNMKLHKLLEKQRNQVNQAQIEIQHSNIVKQESEESEALMNRKQATLLLRLAHLDSTLDNIKKKMAEGTLNKADQDSIMRELQNVSGKEKMWELFTTQFEMTNRKFMDLLSERHPNLTKSEKRICAFMLLNLSTKEIAQLLQRSPRTIDVTKYNIRKKLETDLSTDEYLRQIAEEANIKSINSSL